MFHTDFESSDNLTEDSSVRTVVVVLGIGSTDIVSMGNRAGQSLDCHNRTDHSRDTDSMGTGPKGILWTDSQAGKDSRCQESALRGWKDIAWTGTRAEYTPGCSEDLKDNQIDRDQKGSESQAGQILLAEMGKAPKQYRTAGRT